MRKQYFFRPSPDGYYAWDIDRLIELSKDFQVKEIKLELIEEIDEIYWFGEGNDPTCREIFEHAKLIQKTDLKYPIILSEEGRVMDGMHRVGKAFLKNHDTIKAVQFDKDPKPDFKDVYPEDLPY